MLKRFNIVFEYVEKRWVASCSELRITLEEGSFDALVVRIKVAIQDIVQTELDYKDEVELVISMCDRTESIKAVG